MQNCSSQLGKITEAHLTAIFRCREHAPCDALVAPFRGIEEIVSKAMTTTQRPLLEIGEETRPYEDTEIRALLRT